MHIVSLVLEICGGLVSIGVIVRVLYRIARGIERVHDAIGGHAAELDDHEERIVLLERQKRSA